MALFDRLIAEMMILGLMGLTVWCCIQGNVFKKISKTDKINNRPDKYQLLHMVEDVHFEIFIAMVFIFSGMTFTIYRALKYQASIPRQMHTQQCASSQLVVITTRASRFPFASATMRALPAPFLRVSQTMNLSGTLSSVTSSSVHRTTRFLRWAQTLTFRGTWL
jgi:hypothetical protein